MALELEGLRVAIFATDRFEQIDLVAPRAALEAAGARTLLVSDKAGRIRGLNDGNGELFDVAALFDEVSAADFDAALLPGGMASCDRLRAVLGAVSLVRALAEDGKPLAVLGHGAWLLLAAGLVHGRRIAAPYGLDDDIRAAGGVWIDEDVCVDGNWVSGSRPAAIPAFVGEMRTLLAEYTAGFRRSLHRGEPRELPGGTTYGNAGTESDATTGGGAGWR